MARRMIMKRMKGYPLPFGVSEKDGVTNFSVAVESGKECILKLYRKGNENPVFETELLEEDAVGEVRFVAFPKEKVNGLEYCYEIDGESYIDPYVKSVVEKEGALVRGKITEQSYDWEDDKTLEIPYHQVIAYSLHVRGFTKHSSSKVKKKGTFQGVIEKIPYLKELGINQIQCMPVYGFLESKNYKNYWGYGPAYCFAVKDAYAGMRSADQELKDMVKACHKEGIEVVLNLPFTAETPKHIVVECLRYYVMEFHIDGFVLNPYNVALEHLKADPILKKTKLLHNKDDFQCIMRRFLKGDEAMVKGVMWWMRQRTEDTGSCNYITNHTGFTMMDLVSYDSKHNEDNGEHNQDGPEINYSWNCGVEGPTRKKAILELRKQQIRNAFFLLLSSQGTPCILAGDEFGNTQKGNNNVYCQDNEIAWLNWKGLEKERAIFEYVKSMIQLRKKYPFLHAAKPLLGADYTSCGVPDISFHGESAWQIPENHESRQLGVYYHLEEGENTDYFIAYNMYWFERKFALPKLPKGKKWYRIYSTADAILTEQEVSEAELKETIVDGRTIVMYVGR